MEEAPKQILPGVYFDDFRTEESIRAARHAGNGTSTPNGSAAPSSVSAVSSAQDVANPGLPITTTEEIELATIQMRRSHLEVLQLQQSNLQMLEFYEKDGDEELKVFADENVTAMRRRCDTILAQFARLPSHAHHVVEEAVEFAKRTLIELEGEGEGRETFVQQLANGASSATMNNTMNGGLDL